MLTIYILILLAFLIIYKIFHNTFFKKSTIGNKNYKLDLFVEPIIRVFNAFKYNNFNLCTFYMFQDTCF